MGTRHLVGIVKDGEYKVAKYCQFDGYPEGNGVDILTFLWDKLDIDKLKERVDHVKEPDEEKLKELYFDIGIDIEGQSWQLSLDQSKVFEEQYPLLHRNTSSEVFELIQESKDEDIYIKNNIDFVVDSLFCEWAYIVDLDKETFEVYEGFVDEPLPEDERFYEFNDKSDGGYYPCELIKSYDLFELPNEEEFVEFFEEREEIA